MTPEILRKESRDVSRRGKGSHLHSQRVIAHSKAHKTVKENLNADKKEAKL